MMFLIAAAVAAMATMAAASDSMSPSQTASPVTQTITQTVTVTPTGSGTNSWSSKPSNESSMIANMTRTRSGPAATHTVVVGAGGKNVYSPNSVNATKGDFIVFNFLALNHTLTESTFDSPCVPNGAFNTGFQQFNPDNKTNLFDVVVAVQDDSRPLWFYCAQKNHCQQGMVFGINPGGKMDQFIANAKGSNSTVSNTTVVSTAPKTTASPSYANTTTTSPSSKTTGSPSHSNTTISTLTPTKVSSSASSAYTPIQIVRVGAHNGSVLAFDPPFLTNISAGSIVHFDFRAVNHTLTESSFQHPCQKLNGTDIDTNFNNVNKYDIPNLHPFDYTFDSNRPRYFYCKQSIPETSAGHCGKGMVFAVNADQNKFNQFQAAANSTRPRSRRRGGWAA